MPLRPTRARLAKIKLARPTSARISALTLLARDEMRAEPELGFWPESRREPSVRLQLVTAISSSAVQSESEKESQSWPKFLLEVLLSWCRLPVLFLLCARCRLRPTMQPPVVVSKQQQQLELELELEGRLNKVDKPGDR